MSRFQLESDFASRLSELGWEATIAFPFLCALSRKHRSVIPIAAVQSMAEDFNGVPAELFDRGVQELLRAGELKLEERTVRRGRGVVTKTGYVLSFNAAVDPRPRSTQRKNVPGTKKNVPGTKKNVPGTKNFCPPERSQVTGNRSVSVGDTTFFAADEKNVPGTKKNVPGTNPSRARTRSAHAVKNKQTHRTKNKTPQTPLAPSPVWVAYRLFSPHSQEQIPAVWGELLLAVQNEHSVEDLQAVIRWAFQSLDYEWHRHRGLTSFDQILSSKHLPSRIEAARRWNERGDSTIKLVEREPMFKLLAPEDQVELKGWPSLRQKQWVGLVQAGHTGAAAMNEISPPWVR